MTINNPDMDGDLKKAKEWKGVSWVVVGYHVGEEKKVPHYHVAAQFNTKKRLTTIKKRFPTANIQLMKGKEKEVVDYLKKYESKLRLEQGVFKTKNMGAREDLSKARSIILSKRTWSQVVQCEEITNVFAKYPRFCRSIYDNKPMYKTNYEMRPWQQVIVDSLKGEADTRTVNWYWSAEGNLGKTIVASHLVSHHGALLVSGKKADIAYMYDNHPIVIWNLPRDTDPEAVSYHSMESFKDGMLVSTKYVSRMKQFKPPHVVVFANVAPDRSKLSSDRFNVVELTEFIKAHTPEPEAKEEEEAADLPSEDEGSAVADAPLASIPEDSIPIPDTPPLEEMYPSWANDGF